MLGIKKIFYGLVIVVFSSCGDQYFSIGDDLLDGNTFLTETIDTSTVRTYTYNIDSSRSNNLGRILIGASVDSWFGSTSSRGLFNVVLEDQFYLGEEYYKDLLVFDSCVLELVPDGYYYGDTLTAFQIEVYQLKKQLKAHNDGYLYTSTTGFDATDANKHAYFLGATSFLPKPLSSKETSIRMPDAWGLDLFNKFLAYDEAVSTNNDLSKLLRGFSVQIKDGSTPNCFMGFSESSVLRLYYTDKNETPHTNSYIHLAIGTGSIYYNNIVADREGALAPIGNNSRKGTQSILTSQTAFLQNGTGTAIRVELPYLWDYLQSGDDLTIAEAVLKLKIADNTLSKNKLPSSEVNVYLVDSRNNIVGLTSQNVNVSYNLELDRDNYVEIDIRVFVNSILNRDYNPQDYALLIRASDEIIGSSINHWIIDGSHGGENTSLKLKFFKMNN